MKNPDDSMDPRLRRFEDALRRWAARPGPPPRWSGPDVAAGIALRRPVPPARRWRLAGAGLAACAVLAAVVLLGLPPRFQGPPAEPPQLAPAAAVASLDEVLVLWLDADTPLYLTLAPAAEAAGAERSPR